MVDGVWHAVLHDRKANHACPSYVLLVSAVLLAILPPKLPELDRVLEAAELRLAEV